MHWSHPSKEDDWCRYCLICAKKGVYSLSEYIVRWGDIPGMPVCDQHGFDPKDLAKVEKKPDKRDLTEIVQIQFKIN